MTNERGKGLVIAVVALIIGLFVICFAADFLSPTGPHGVGIEVQDK